MIFLIYIQYRSVRTAWKTYLFGEDNGSSISSFDSVPFPIFGCIVSWYYSTRKRWMTFRGKSEFYEGSRFPLVPSSYQEDITRDSNCTPETTV